MADDPRRALGAHGERLAAEHLRRRGFRLLDRNFRTREGELDLVLLDRGVIVFCEVKARVLRRAPPAGHGGGPAAGSPLEAIGPAKRRRLRRLAGIWLQRQRETPERARALPAGFADVRFDVVGIVLAPDGTVLRLEHAENAF